ncbi:MAG TPA: hypothetical protein VFT56_14115 [Sphingomonas sp.]|nr:hypothetical protein [Sphingomonas sp.]
MTILIPVREPLDPVPPQVAAERDAAPRWPLDAIARLHAAARGTGDRPVAIAVAEASALLRAMAA